MVLSDDTVISPLEIVEGTLQPEKDTKCNLKMFYN